MFMNRFHFRKWEGWHEGCLRNIALDEMSYERVQPKIKQMRNGVLSLVPHLAGRTMKLPCLKPLRNTLYVGGALLGGASAMLGQADAGKIDQLQKENQELRKRLDALEAVAQKEGILPSGSPAPK